MNVRAPSASFFLRYFIPLAVFTIVGVVLPLALVIPSQRAFVRERAKADAISTAELAGRALANAMGTGRLTDVKNEMTALRAAYPIFGSMAVVNSMGKIIAHTESSQEGRLVVDLFPPPVSTIIRTVVGSNGAQLALTLPLKSGGEVRGTLVTEVKVETPATGSWSGVDYLLALTACLLGLGALVSVQLSRSQTEPKVVYRDRVVASSEEKAPVPVSVTAQPVTELLSAVLEATPAGLFVVDEVTRKIHHANGAFCRLWGLEEIADSVRGGTIDYETVSSRCNAATEHVVLPALGTSDLDPLRLIDEELRCRDGRLVRCFSLPLAIGGRHLRLYVHTDVTAERRRELDLTQSAATAQAAVQEKAAFGVHMSRTLRAPLTGLLNTAGLLSDTTLSPQQSNYVDAVRASAEDVLGMVNNLLDLAAMDSGALTLSSNPFTLRRVIHESLEPLALSAHRKNIDLAGSIAEELPVGFNGDSERLRQVLVNLVSSAVQATDQGEVVVNVSAAPAEVASSAAGIRIATDGSRSRPQSTRQSAVRAMLRFEVRDTGRNITPDEQASLFQIMTAPSADAQYRTHLPLLVAKRLVELMGGHVGVESDPGHGNTLWFTVPMLIDAQAKEDIAPSIDSFSSCRVLVVDDNATVRTLLEQQLRSWHITGESAASGEEALRLLRAAVDYGTPYSLAIIDAQMPEMDGLTLIEQIHGERRLADLPLFLLTSSPQVSDDTYPGVAMTLSKPVHSTALYQAIVTHLGVKEGERRMVPSRTAAARKGRPRGRLLLAEDNLVNQKIALRMLDKLGFQTDVVANGNEAVEAAAKTRYDAILMDCQMPEMDGVTATTLIRRSEGADQHVPIIAITANSMDADRERCMAAGMDDFLAKPVRAADIEAVLARWSSTDHATDGAPYEATLRLAPRAAQSA